MTHLSDNSQRLSICKNEITDFNGLNASLQDFNEVCLILLPENKSESAGYIGELDQIAASVQQLGPEATLIILGETPDLVHFHQSVSSFLHYQLWIAIKRAKIRTPALPDRLPEHHIGALVYTRYKGSLKHAKTRIAYSFCPACDKTTKDYGGKKHTYHEYGTLMSDVWRDLSADLDGSLDEVIERFADLFGVAPCKNLLVLDGRKLQVEREPAPSESLLSGVAENLFQEYHTANGKLLNGDCLEQLRSLPDNSVDFAFADPPYNLKKQYQGYSDDRSIQHYFEWCDEWITELGRVLRPGRTITLLNIPLWSIRHFLFMEREFQFQNWIAWDALSFPVRLIMPSHYTILCFTKGHARQLPGFDALNGQANGMGENEKYLQPLAEGFCLRSHCITRRKALLCEDRGPLTDLWWDVHRLKHNSRRVDHPCQLPPQLMYRLISLFTYPGETVLDCFNGAGTTTLAAHQLGRNYVGIEASEEYYNLALKRHREICQGLDPFRKEERVLTAKNSPVRRMAKQNYAVPKKTLQLEVKRVAGLLGHLPSREELALLGSYDIDYYDRYFVSWGEVCAAARTTGMSETRSKDPFKTPPEQLSLFTGNEG